MAARRRPPTTFGDPMMGQTTTGGASDTYGAGSTPVNNTGVSGYGPGGIPPPVPQPTPPPPAETENHPNGPEPGPRPTYAVEANQAKLNDPTHQSAMYRMLRTVQGFDPTKGLKQAGLIDALNALGLGKFNALDDDEIEILDPSDECEGVTKWDLIKGFDTGNGVWVGQGLNGKAAADYAAAQAAAAPTPGTAPQATGSIPSPTQGSSAPGMPTIAPEYLEMLENLFRDNGEEYGAPQSAGVFPDDVGVQQVGQDPLSQLATGGLAALIQSGGAGYSALNDDVDRTLAGLLDQSDGGLNQEVINARLESAREASERQRKASTDTLRAQLAGRGLLGSGPERTGLERIAETFNADQATALRDIFANEGEAADGRMMSALGLATGLGQSQTRSLLDSINSVTDRQQVLSDIAIDTLDRNMAWNQFLAEYGLKRDQIMQEIRQGRIEGLIPLLQMFINSAGTAARGYV